MNEISQWSVAIVLGISIAGFFAWFNKSGSDFKDGFEPKRNKGKGKEQRHANKDLKINKIENNSKSNNHCLNNYLTFYYQDKRKKINTPLTEKIGYNKNNRSYNIGNCIKKSTTYQLQ